jgi:clan AA aspartic protease (TIGR02281 family)
MRPMVLLAACVPILAGCASAEETAALNASAFDSCVSESVRLGMDAATRCGTERTARQSFAARWRYLMSPPNPDDPFRRLAARQCHTLKECDSLNAYSYPNDLQALRPLAEYGDARAQVRLGGMYEHGQGVVQDPKEAVRLYSLAASQGDGDGQTNLGLMYENGKGVTQDYVRAYMWYFAASLRSVSSHGVSQQQAAYYRDNVFAKLMPAQATQALEMARQCQLRDFRQCDGLNSPQAAIETASLTPPTASAAPIGPVTPPDQATSDTTSPTPPRDSAASKTILLENDRGTYVVPVVINGVITLKFTVDSGAADVSIPADVFLTLIRAGTIGDKDYVGQKTYVLADGSTVPSQTFRIRSLKIGDVVMENVLATVASVKGDLLLGQSFLGRLKSWSIDNTAHAMIIN